MFGDLRPLEVVLSETFQDRLDLTACGGKHLRPETQLADIFQNRLNDWRPVRLAVVRRHDYFRAENELRVAINNHHKL